MSPAWYPQMTVPTHYFIVEQVRSLYGKLAPTDTTPRSREVAEGNGERGRNRTFNLLIKSQLLCQLSYAPRDCGKVGTNFDYIIRCAPSLARLGGLLFQFVYRSATLGATLGLEFPEARLMSWNKTALSALLAGIILSAALAADATAQVPIRNRPSAAPGITKRPRLEPCWEVAGISKSAIQERRALAQQARQQVEAACANSSLSVQQRRQEIQRIHQQERQQIEAIITPAQQEAMRSCQEGRNSGHNGGHLGGGHGGPCGEMPAPHNSVPPHRSNPQQGDEAPPNGTAKPN